MSSKQVLLATLMGLSDSVVFLMHSLACKRGDPSTIALFGYTNLLYAFMADTVIFRRPLDIGVLIPTLFIAVVTISIGVYKCTKDDQNAQTIEKEGTKQDGYSFMDTSKLSSCSANIQGNNKTTYTVSG